MRLVSTIFFVAATFILHSGSTSFHTRNTFSQLEAFSPLATTTTRTRTISSSLSSPPLFSGPPGMFRTRTLTVVSRRVMTAASAKPVETSSSTNATTSSTSVGAMQRPLKGVVFDMDGTLTIPNLDFDEMYRRCGIDNKDGKSDILHEIAQMIENNDIERATQCSQIIEEMEEEGRRTLQLMPGAYETLMWLHNHQIPTALVTRNTQATVDRLEELLQERQQQHHSSSSSSSPRKFFDVAIPRDFGNDNNLSIPPKPDPAAMNYIIEKSWNGKTSTDTSSKDLEPDMVLMVGDSISNDVVFGQHAGTRTALLQYQTTNENGLSRSYKETRGTDSAPDFVVSNLWDLPRQIWLSSSSPSSSSNEIKEQVSMSPSFEILGQLGTNSPLIKYDTPTLSVEEDPLSHAIVKGDLTTIKEKFSSNDIMDAFTSVSQGVNTPLVWAADAGHIDLVQYLVEEVLIPSCGDNNNLLHSALNHRGYLESTAVCRAARRGHSNIVTMLASNGANLDIPNCKMQYPLHFAAFKKHLNCVNSLLDAGANPFVLDRKGRPPSLDTSDDVIRKRLEDAMQETLQKIGP